MNASLEHTRVKEMDVIVENVECTELWQRKVRSIIRLERGSCGWPHGYIYVGRGQMYGDYRLFGLNGRCRPL